MYNEYNVYNVYNVGMYNVCVLFIIYYDNLSIIHEILKLFGTD